MATTAAGTPYVESSDLVANYPGVSLALADHIDGLDGGKVLQVVRATDETNRTTTSTSFVDITGMSITITPKKTTSAILLLAFYQHQTSGSSVYPSVGFSDSSNNILEGNYDSGVGTSSGDLYVMQSIASYASPATISAVTYKLRFKTNSGTLTVRNATRTGQLYAIEVAA
jgi:hypothetical protein